MTRSTQIRNGALVLIFVDISIIFIITVCLAFNIPLIVTNGASLISALSYVPAALVLSARGKESRYDGAKREVGFLVFHAITGLAGAILAGVTGGPAYCSRLYYLQGLNSSDSSFSWNAIVSVQRYCDTMSAIIALACLECAGSLLWIWWIRKVIFRLSYEKSELGNERKLWKTSVSEIMRRDLRDPIGGGAGHHGGHGVTPFVHEPGELERAQTTRQPSISTVQTQSRNPSLVPGQSGPGGGPSLQLHPTLSIPVTRTITHDSTLNADPVLERQRSIVIADPEVDHGPYIPPPPYQPHYASSSSASPPTPASPIPAALSESSSPARISTQLPSIAQRYGAGTSLSDPGSETNTNTNTGTNLSTFSNPAYNSYISTVPEVHVGPVTTPSSSPSPGPSVPPMSGSGGGGGGGGTGGFAGMNLGPIVSSPISETDELRQQHHAFLAGEGPAIGSIGGAGGGQRSELRRVLDEKEESKEVVRRALER
ncbi:hypothetical protein I317_05944 [Kwoniella heveanensis CBS 569]|nr:hypothetical protein I317_05944 [Kwoniella heveanensis CBS 569]